MADEESSSAMAKRTSVAHHGQRRVSRHDSKVEDGDDDELAAVLDGGTTSGIRRVSDSLVGLFDTMLYTDCYFHFLR